MAVFDPSKFKNKHIHIIGAGATGSRIAVGLSKLGLENLHIYDYDVVESHNVANQVYSVNDIGQKKSDAIGAIIKRYTGVDVECNDMRVGSDNTFEGVVYLLTDTMESRKEIWESCIKGKVSVELMVETRMGVSEGRVYLVNPICRKHQEEWEDTLYDDDEGVESVCGSKISVGPTAEIISGLAVWQFIKWYQRLSGTDINVENELIFSLNPPIFLKREFQVI